MINCADYHLPDHDANVIQLSNSYPHVSPFIQNLIFLFVIPNILNIKEIAIHNSETFMLNA